MRAGAVVGFLGAALAFAAAACALENRQAPRAWAPCRRCSRLGPPLGGGRIATDTCRRDKPRWS
jgi:hypothetical protein